MPKLPTNIPPDYRPRMPVATLALILALALTTAFAASAAGERLEEHKTLTEELRFPAAGQGEAVLRVCNINGSVVARGTAGTTGRLVVHETYTARTPEALERAQKEMAVEISRQGGVIEVSIGGPCEGRQDRHDRHGDGDRYSARHEMEIEIPHGVEADLGTVNGGEVRLSGHRGPFRVANVNGGVSVQDVAGSGSASAVNGPVKVRFAESPVEACSFTSVNGQIDLAFPSDLSADFRFKTLNGEIFTDFPFEASTVTSTNDNEGSSRGKGRYVVKKRWSTGARIGRAGGPEHMVTTVNGDIYIRNRAK